MMKLIAFFLFVLFATSVNAQDPHFSQFFSSPMTLSPAFTGKFDGQFRAAANYRNQWPTINRAFETATISVDFPILTGRLPSTDIWGIGLMGYTDKSAAGAVKFNYFSLSTAYHKGLDEDGYKQLGLGFQATYSDFLINTNKLTFGDQLTPFGFTKPTDEVLISNKTLKATYFDLNAGILYTASTTDKNNFYAGVSLYHINRPKQEFTGVNYNLYPRATLHAGGYFPASDLVTVHLSGLYSTQAGAHETLLGGAVQLLASDLDAPQPVSFYGGAWVRFGDALIPYVGLEFSDLRVGVTYDINTSSLKTASQSRGGIEISLIYIKQHPDGKGLPCPKF